MRAQDGTSYQPKCQVIFQIHSFSRSHLTFYSRDFQQSAATRFLPRHFVICHPSEPAQWRSNQNGEQATGRIGSHGAYKFSWVRPVASLTVLILFAAGTVLRIASLFPQRALTKVTSPTRLQSQSPPSPVLSLNTLHQLRTSLFQPFGQPLRLRSRQPRLQSHRGQC